ncbi:hypothetical protein KDL01_37250, partial [Actinospica durhamensis]
TRVAPVSRPPARKRPSAPDRYHPEHVEFRIGGFTLGFDTVEAACRVHGVDPQPGAPTMALILWTDDVDHTFVTLTAGGNLVELVSKAS